MTLYFAHRKHLWFAYDSQSVTITFLINLNWLFPEMNKHCVSCYVGTKLIYVVEINFILPNVKFVRYFLLSLQ